MSQEVLASYVQQHPDSIGGINLKACNYFKLYNGKAAEVRRKMIQEEGRRTEGRGKERRQGGEGKREEERKKEGGDEEGGREGKREE